MVSVQKALEIIDEQPFPVRLEKVLLEVSEGRALAEVVKADRDFPPFDRVMMDGIAIQFGQLKDGKPFLIEDLQPAGKARKRLQHYTNAMEVMTGAILPDGTDTVIRYEDVKIEGDTATVNSTKLQKGDHVHPRANDARAGDELLTPGIVISPAEVALMASVGLREVQVFGFPDTAVISTGDELVDITATPREYQVRQSNSYALLAAMNEMGWKGKSYYLADNEQTVLETLRIILFEHEVVTISGGVSKGKFDFIPSALDKLGIRQLFYQVSQRPGKPMWVGASEKGRMVFALPGNPVSTYLCFFKYIKPWALSNFKVKPRELTAALTEDFLYEPEYTHFLQVRVNCENGRLMAYPMPGFGSGDFANLKNVDGFLELPGDRSSFKKDESFPFIPFRP